MFEIEKIALATMLVYPHFIDECGYSFSADEFKDVQNSKIAMAILSIKAEGSIPSPSMCYHWLKTKNDVAYVNEVYLDQLPRYAEPTVRPLEVFKGYSINNKLNAIAQSIIHKTTDHNVDGFDLLLKLQKDLGTINNSSDKKSYSISLADAVVKVVSEVNKPLIAREKTLVSPWKSVNDQIGSFMPGDMISIGARPGMGKTHIASQLSMASAKQGIPSAFIGMEMTQMQVAKRYIQTELGIASSKFRGNRIDQSDIDKITSNLHLFNYPQQLTQVASPTPDFIINEMRREIANGTKTFVLDYLQRVRFGGEGRRGFSTDENMGDFLRQIKNLCLEYGLYAFILSQLNREVENDKFKMPNQMNYFKGSGFIEAESDFIWALWRPAYYNIFVDANGVDVKDKMLILGLKARDASFKDTYLNWSGNGYVDPEEINTINDTDDF